MRVTQILFRQHLGRHFTKHWYVQGKRKIIETYAEKPLLKKGIPIYKATDLIKEEKTFKKYDIIGGKFPKSVPLDKNHPNWHDKILLTYKDNNVLLEGLTQAKILTNTVELKDGLPDSIVLNNISKDINTLCKRAILNSHILDAEQKKLPKIKDPERPAWNFPRIYGVTQDRVYKLLISKLLQIIESTTDYNLVKERLLLNDLYFSFPFEKHGDVIQFQMKGDTVLTSSKPLRPVSTEPTDALELPSLFPIKHTVTLNEENIYEIENIYPISKNVLKSHPHTIIIHYNNEEVKNIFEEEVTETQIHARSLLKTFTVAAAYARQRYGADVKSLPNNVTVQCVQTNGHFFHFGILQLNTLDLESDDNRNIWYQTPIMYLFNKCCYKLGKPVLEEYNNEVIKHLYAFYNNV